MKVAYAVALGWALIASCSSSTPGADGPVSDKAIDDLATSFCTRTAQCYGDVWLKALAGDASTCASRLALELKATSRGQGTQVKESDAQKCKAAVDAAPCAKLLSDDMPECEIKGTLADGVACAGDAQCASGACHVPDDAACGTCRPRALEGADCSQSKCLRGLACGPSNTCVKRIAEGGACDASSVCEPAMVCLNGKCTKGLARGAACRNGPKEPPCDTSGGLYCKPASATDPNGTCSPFTIAATGQSCGVTLQPSIDYAVCSNADCIGTSGQPPTATCQAHLTDGSPCQTGGSGTCQFPATCRGGRCAIRDTNACK